MDNDAFIGVLIVMFLSALIASIITATCMQESWQKECVERGHAGYHPKTGEWQWKEQDDE